MTLWASRSEAWRVGAGATATLAAVLLAWALSVNYPRASYGFFSDASTYYGMGHSLADDGDLEFKRDDLVRVSYRTQAVSDNNDGSPRTDGTHVVLDDALGFEVERTGCLV